MRYLLTTLIVLWTWPLTAVAAVTGTCDSCHTMHNSQDGDPMMIAGTGPVATLLRNDCLGCHTGTNNGSNGPFILGDVEPAYGDTGTEGTTNTLAGGNYYWVDEDVGAAYDVKGHNVVGIRGGVDSDDATLVNTPPGGSALGSQLTCAGTTGCHGDRTKTNNYAAMHGGHHNNADAVVSGYRLLDGIAGTEDSDWEYQPTASNHNQYSGEERTSDTDEDSTTISSLCAQCHNDFHNGATNAGIEDPLISTFASPWVRHPTDISMPTTGEYSPFTSYSVIAPVGTSNLDGTYVYTTASDRIVTCISCHRAHGTPYDAILRWDYKGWPVGGYYGCGVCHTEKD